MESTFGERTLKEGRSQLDIPSKPPYGYGAVNVSSASNQSITSSGYTSCLGILTYTPETSVCTLVHHPPGWKNDEIRDYLGFLESATGGKRTYAWFVGDKTKSKPDKLPVFVALSKKSFICNIDINDLKFIDNQQRGVLYKGSTGISANQYGVTVTETKGNGPDTKTWQQLTS